MWEKPTKPRKGPERDSKHRAPDPIVSTSFFVDVSEAPYPTRLTALSQCYTESSFDLSYYEMFFEHLKNEGEPESYSVQYLERTKKTHKSGHGVAFFLQDSVLCLGMLL